MTTFRYFFTVDESFDKRAVHNCPPLNPVIALHHLSGNHRKTFK